MPDFKLIIPTADEVVPGSDPPQMRGHRTVDLGPGQFVFVLGTNGAGKSALMHRFFRDEGPSKTRLTGHRQMWLDSEDMEITSSQRKQTGGHMQQWDSQESARWREQAAQQRPVMVVFDLLRAEGSVAQAIKRAATSGNDAEVKRLAKAPSPIDQINDLFRQSNLPIVLSTPDGDKLLATRKGIGPYSVAQLSDGERAALLLGAAVLTEQSGQLFLIDEPERHLHRSIAAPLLGTLFQRRADCSFVISTHDVDLAAEFSNAQIVLVRESKFQGERPTAWDVDVLPRNSNIPDSIKTDILGGRRRMLFVEGTGTGKSLDVPLYSILFPNVSVVAKGSCRDVESAVDGIRGASDAHWVDAFGVIDSDRRPAAEIVQLKGKRIFAVDAYSVEAIYYHPEMIKRVAANQEKLLGTANLYAKAEAAAVAAMKPEQGRMCARVVEKAVRHRIFTQMPKQASIAAQPVLTIHVDATKDLAEEGRTFADACVKPDLLILVSHYPARDTPALTAIASQLRFKSRSDYEAAVRQVLLSDVTARDFARGLFNGLYAELSK